MDDAASARVSAAGSRRSRRGARLAESAARLLVGRVAEDDGLEQRMGRDEIADVAFHDRQLALERRALRAVDLAEPDREHVRRLERTAEPMKDVGEQGSGGAPACRRPFEELHRDDPRLLVRRIFGEERFDVRERALDIAELAGVEAHEARPHRERFGVVGRMFRREDALEERRRVGGPPGEQVTRLEGPADPRLVGLDVEELLVDPDDVLGLGGVAIEELGGPGQEGDLLLRLGASGRGLLVEVGEGRPVPARR